VERAILKALPPSEADQILVPNELPFEFHHEEAQRQDDCVSLAWNRRGLHTHLECCLRRHFQWTSGGSTYSCQR